MIWCRALGSQLGRSHNEKDSWVRFVARLGLFLLFTIKGLKVAIQSIKREQLGSTVIYKGMVYYISNWAGGEYVSLSRDGDYVKDVPRDEFANVINLPEIFHRLRFGFGFYMDNWSAIDIDKYLHRKSCNI